MPVATDNRILALASLRIYDPAAGDPVLTDRGLWWYDLLATSEQFSTPPVDTSGNELLEFLPDLGLTLRPFVILQDTHLTNYTTSGGTWEERRPSTGSPRKYRLVQLDTTANLQWSATSKFPLPADPSVAFSFVFLDTPADHDAATYPPFVRIEFGGGLWALEFSKTQGSRLLQKIAGAWVVAAPLQEPVGFAGADNDEKFVIVRVHRGRLLVSTDYGRTYLQYSPPDGSAVAVAAGTFVLRGQGGACVFGLQQVRYYPGTYTSPTRSTFQPRLALVTATISGRYAVPGSTAVAFTDLSVPASQVAQYGIALTPEAVVGVPFTFYRSPEVYSVTFHYPTVASAPSLSYATPFDGDLLTVDVSKPIRLDESSATVTVYREATTAFDFRALRWRKCELWLGELAEDGVTVTTRQVFTGYVRRVRIRQTRYGQQFITLTLDNHTAILKRQKWTDQNRAPLGGQSLNGALNEILNRAGLNVGYVNWNPAGDLILLPVGSPESPAFLPRRGETFWQTMETLARGAGFELVGTDDGAFGTVALNFVQPTVTATWKADPTTLDEALQGIDYGVDAAEACTCVEVFGQDDAGAAIYGFAVDQYAETVALSERFAPWRESLDEDVPGASSLGWVTRVAAARALDALPLKWEAEAEGQVRLGVARRDRAQATGTLVGIADSDEWAVMELRHHYTKEIGQCKTTASLRRLT